MATATIIDSKKAESQRNGSLPTPPHALRMAARAFLRLARADVVWLAVRESGSHVAVVRWSEGAGSTAGLGRAIEAGVGVGGAVLAKGEPWWGKIGGDGDTRLSDRESTVLCHEGVRHLMAIPLLTTGFWGEARIEGVAYVGARGDVAWRDRTVAAGQRLGRHAARPVRDAQRVSEVTHRWEHVWAHLVTSGDAADRRLDRVAHQIAADARTVLRSGLGIVFRLDAASGALHSLGVDGEVIPGDLVPAMRRGQVLPPGCGGASRAVALGKTFIAADYVSGEVVVPPIMAEAVATLPRITTMSVPLIVGPDVIGAVTVGRFKATPLMNYSEKDVRIAARLAKAAAPLLAQAQLAAEHARRQEGVSELSRLAGSLTQSLSVSAVCGQLLRSVLALVHGTSAAIWDSRGQSISETCPPGILREPKDPRLGRMLDQVTQTRQAFWTPDLANDPRLVAPDGARSTEPREARAVLVTPIRIRETLLGLLAVSGVTGRAFNDADVELVQALADQAALGIANARAYDELQVSNVQLLRHEKLVAMGRLTSGLAHELRNPLQHGVGLTSL